jgi:hypothetical protein
MPQNQEKGIVEGIKNGRSVPDDDALRRRIRLDRNMMMCSRRNDKRNKYNIAKKELIWLTMTRSKKNEAAATT